MPLITETQGVVGIREVVEQMKETAVHGTEIDENERDGY
jgi:hypothetical protein